MYTYGVRNTITIPALSSAGTGQESGLAYPSDSDSTSITVRPQRRGPRRGDSDVVSTAMTLSVVVAIGLGMLGLLSSYSSIGRQEAVQSLNKDSLVLRSMLGADYVVLNNEQPVHSGG
jgi:1-deoxy-D-xylulose 5-phosphate reductoisomerase